MSLIETVLLLGMGKFKLQIIRTKSVLDQRGGPFYISM